MNKILFSALLLAAACPAFAAEGFRFGYCEDQVKANGADDQLYAAAAIRIPAAQVAEWAGDDIAAVSIGFGTGRSKDYTLFLSYDLGGEPFYTQAGTVRRFKNWNDVDLAQPVPVSGLEPGRDLYVGYYMYHGNPGDFMLGTDGVSSANADAALMACCPDAQPWGKFQPRNADMGSASIRVVLTGDNLPYDMLDVGALELPKYATPGQPFDAGLRVRNIGANDINSIKLTLNIGDNAPEEREIALSLPSSSSTVLKLADCLVPSELVPCPVSVEITQVNDKARTGRAEAVTAAMEPLKRTLVAELAFAYNGSWCVRSLQGCQEIRKNYSPDDFFCILAHESLEAYYDANLSCESYDGWREVYRDGLPQGTVCRENPKGEIAARIAGQLYKDYQQECYYRVGLESSVGADGNVHATASLFPAYASDNARLAWTFVLTEDGVGPHWQYNKYGETHDPYNECPDFAYQEVWLKWTYDDLARYAEQVMGIPGSVPAQLEAGKYYDYEVTLPTDHVTDIKCCNISALLLDLDTGAVVNAKRLRADGSQVGVEAVEARPEAAQAVYYDLMGRRVANPQGGIFVKVQGGKSQKVKL